MSLTSEIKKARSPLGRWMREQFPDTRFFTRAIRTAQTGQPLRCGLEAESPPWMHSWVGTAFDYRLRMALAPMTIGDTVAGRMPQRLRPGVHVMTEQEETLRFVPYPQLSAREEATRRNRNLSLWDWHQDWIDSLIHRIPGYRGCIDHSEDAPEIVEVGDWLERLFAEVQNWLDRYQPSLHGLSGNEERQLAQYCLWLGFAEDWVRTGNTRGGLWDGLKKQGIPAASASVLPPSAVTDIAQLSSTLTPERLTPFRQTPQHLNPVFSGSGFVGGADADLIAGACLWEVKCTVKVSGPGWWLYQLLGYVLLDWDQTYGLTQAGLYLPRRDQLLQWRLEELLVQSRCPRPDPDWLREDLRRLCTAPDDQL